jgi:hypothetical protein
MNLDADIARLLIKRIHQNSIDIALTFDVSNEDAREIAKFLERNAQMSWESIIKNISVIN